MVGERATSRGIILLLFDDAIQRTGFFFVGVQPPPLIHIRHPITRQFSWCHKRTSLQSTNFLLLERMNFSATILLQETNKTECSMQRELGKLDKMTPNANFEWLTCVKAHLRLIIFRYISIHTYYFCFFGETEKEKESRTRTNNTIILNVWRKRRQKKFQLPGG